MPDIASILSQNAAAAWFYLPAAVLLGALHGLEPGHSKSLMAAFIIAIRGTPAQAVLLGLSATVGHTIVVWALAAVGLWLGDKLIAERAEPWLILLSGLLIVALALRLLYRLHRMRKAGRAHAHHHDHSHDHAHDRHDDGHNHMSPAEMRTHYAGRSVTNGEIMWFGFTGGLLPCPAAIGVLLISLQLREFALGMAMVLAFSVGLAATLVGVGMIAAWGVGRAGRRFPLIDRFAPYLPTLSAAVVLIVGLAVAAQGLNRVNAAKRADLDCARTGVATEGCRPK